MSEFKIFLSSFIILNIQFWDFMIWYVEIFLTVPRIPRKVCRHSGGGGGGGRVSDVEISGEFNIEVIGILTGPE